MRVLFFLIVLVFALWVLRRATSGNRPPRAKAPAAQAPQDMVACVHCGVHLPRDEAVSGTLGLYCGTAHRSAAGDRNAT